MKRLLILLILTLLWSCSSDNDGIVDTGNGNGSPDTNIVHGTRIRAVNTGTGDLLGVVIKFPLTHEVVDLGPIQKGEATEYVDVTYAFEWVDADITFLCEDVFDHCQEDTILCEYRMANRPQGWLARGDYTYRIWNYELAPYCWYATLQE
jgi:hypothetical protein